MGLSEVKRCVCRLRGYNDMNLSHFRGEGSFLVIILDNKKQK